jgi:hypothetical protein
VFFSTHVAICKEHLAKTLRLFSTRVLIMFALWRRVRGHSARLSPADGPAPAAVGGEKGLDKQE